MDCNNPENTKMMKLLIALLPLLALCNGQGLSNSVDLSPTYKLSWEVLATAGDIVLEIEAETQGWVSLSITNLDNNGVFADVFWVGYDEATKVSYSSDMNFNLTSSGPGLGHTTPLVDASQDVVLQSYGFRPSDKRSLIRCKRSLNTGDIYDVPIIQGNYTVGWAYGENSAAPFVHVAQGFQVLSFIP